MLANCDQGCSSMKFYKLSIVLHTSYNFLLLNFRHYCPAPVHIFPFWLKLHKSPCQNKKDVTPKFKFWQKTVFLLMSTVKATQQVSNIFRFYLKIGDSEPNLFQKMEVSPYWLKKRRSQIRKNWSYAPFILTQRNTLFH